MVASADHPRVSQRQTKSGTSVDQREAPITESHGGSIATNPTYDGTARRVVVGPKSSVKNPQFPVWKIYRVTTRTENVSSVEYAVYCTRKTRYHGRDGVGGDAIV